MVSEDEKDDVDFNGDDEYFPYNTHTNKQDAISK